MRAIRSFLLLTLILLVLTGCTAPEAVPAASPSPAPPTVTSSPVPLDLTPDEIATLQSLEQVDDYPLYVMHYVGAYEEAGASRVDPSGPGWSCSLFAALGDEDNRLYGRNFDWVYSPALLLFTDPPDGYASVSMVDMAYLDFAAGQLSGLADLSLAEREPLLVTPFWPFDGMNEHGLAVGMAAVPASEMPYDPTLPTIDSLSIIRLMLDHARTVDEAVDILAGHNIDWAGGPPLHYLIADPSGRAVLVEFYDGEMVLLPNENPWHLATNHLRVTAEGDGGCDRYALIERTLVEGEGRLTLAQAMGLLSAVSQPAVTQWSVVYGMRSGEIRVALGGAYDAVHTFQFDLAER